MACIFSLESENCCLYLHQQCHKVTPGAETDSLAAPTPFQPGSAVPLLAGRDGDTPRVTYHPTRSCPTENTHSPLLARELATHRAWLEASVSLSPLTSLWKLAAKEERWQLGTHPMQWLFSAAQTLLNTVVISYISTKRGKVYFDNKDTAAAG